MDVEQSARLIAVLRVMWPNHPIPDIQAFIVGYQMALDDISYEDAMAAAARHIKTCRFFPTPSELRPESPRMNPADYQGTAYLDVPWMRMVGSGTPVAIGTAGQRRKAG